jgi:hypothetical protein
MRANTQRHPANAFSRVTLLLCGSLLLAAPLFYFLVCIPNSSPPDLRGCTRIEIEYRPNALKHLFTGEAPNLLNPEEREYLRSFRTCAVTDRDQIEAFARVVALGRFTDRIPRTGRISFSLAAPMHLVCYRDDKQVASFCISGGTLVTDSKRTIFHYPVGVLVLDEIDPPQIRPFRLRARVAHP